MKGGAWPPAVRSPPTSLHPPSLATTPPPLLFFPSPFPQDLSIHTPRRGSFGSCDTSAGTAGAPLPPLPGTPHTTAALRACKKLRPSLDFGPGRPPAHPHYHPRSSVDWVAAAAAATSPTSTPSPPVPLSLPSVSLAGLLPDQVEHAIGAAKRAAPGGRGPLGLHLDTAALVRDLNAARGAAVAGRRFSACF